MADIVKMIANRIGLATREEIDAVAHASYAEGFNEARAYDDYHNNGNDEPSVNTNYRRIGDTGSQLDVDRGDLFEKIWRIYQLSPLAKQAFRLLIGFILGDGFAFSVEDEKLQKHLEAFWRVNKLDERLEQFVLQLFLFGEQVFPVFVRQSDGRVKLGYLPPETIVKVVTHPENVLEKWAVVIDSGDHQKKIFRIVREDEGFMVISRGLGFGVNVKYDGLMVTAEQTKLQTWELSMLAKTGLTAYTGSCFYHSVNGLSNEPRGFSEFLQSADWTDLHENSLFAVGEKEIMASFFAWIVELVGVPRENLSAEAQKMRRNPPRRGEMVFKNEKVNYNYVAPDLKQTDSVTAVRAVRLNAITGMGMPEHWFADGDAANRATALVQDGPAHRVLKQKQKVVEAMVKGWLEFARDQAFISGYWRAKDDDAGKIALMTPEMASKDVAAISASLTQLSSSLVAAETYGWITNRTAAQMFAKVANEIGFDIDVDDELSDIEDDQPEGSPFDMMAPADVAAGGDEE